MVGGRSDQGRDGREAGDSVEGKGVEGLTLVKGKKRSEGAREERNRGNF